MNEETELFFEWVKNHFFNTLPLTLIGYILFMFSAIILKTNSLEFVASVGKTGVWVLSLGCCYVIGKASHLLINGLLSRFTSDKRPKEEIQ